MKAGRRSPGRRPTGLAVAEHQVVEARDPVDESFASALIAWQAQAGRKHLPWQGGRDPYRIWLSEIMLQQTQVATVIPYFERFVARFPDIRSLAQAPLEQVLELWSGLGYYSRARNLHRCAQVILIDHGGLFPRTPEQLVTLPGIGRSTAAAIAAFAFGHRAAILDGNVKRVLCRCFAIDGHPGTREVEQALWSLAESLLPDKGIEAYTQGLMDLGATVCTRSRPACARCPFVDRCRARRLDRVAELPAPRPRRVARHQDVALLVIWSGGSVLLKRRPDRGIWGGLWSLPEVALSPVRPSAAAPVDEAQNLDETEVVPAACADLMSGLGLRRFASLAPCALPHFDHAFTHYTLRARPWLLDLGVGAGEPWPVGPGDDRSDGDRDDAADNQADNPGSDHRAGVEADVWRWLDVSALDAAALPRPVKTLLMSLRGPQASLARSAPATAVRGARSDR